MFTLCFFILLCYNYLVSTSKGCEVMNHDFCTGCNINSNLPSCAVGYAPDNAYIENIINNDILPSAEHFICHKASQDLSGGKLAILDKCDDCCLCNIRCPYSNIDYTTFFSPELENVIFNDLGKACILFQSIFPNSVVAAEVHVKGNFRTKRIDLVIKKDSDIYLIKLLKNTDKIPFYMRSYEEAINQYNITYPDIAFHSLCLVPNAKINNEVRVDADIKDLSALNLMFRGV